ncbi:hypothetical protein AGMMS50239_21880 [Bacteroidia bacterium]|nr:hypothetical protein AGMMS50239_21880 [Bacteroidia bacterium]
MGVFGQTLNKITKDKLYGISKKLYSEKDGLEKYLSRKTCELFDLQDKIILYDLTNTYFESRMANSKKAKFGRSKEKRSDCKLLVLALVVNKDEASEAHLHLGLLAYWLVNTVRHRLKQQGIHSEWREIVRVMNTQKVVTTCVENDKNQIVRIRRCSEPKEKVMLIYQALSYRQAPFVRKKSVVPKSENLKNNTTESVRIMSG